MDISKGDLVVSLAGRDKDKVFYVVSVEENFACLADGKTRKLENPKRKKLKHVRFVSRIDSRVADKLRTGDKVLNSELRRDLAVNGQYLTVRTKEDE